MQLQLTSYYLLSLIIYYPLSIVIYYINTSVKKEFLFTKGISKRNLEMLKNIEKNSQRTTSWNILQRLSKNFQPRTHVHRLIPINFLKFIPPNKPRIFYYPLYCYILIRYFHSNLSLRKRKKCFKITLKRTRKRPETKSNKPSSALDFAKVPQVFRGETRRRWLPGRTGGCEPCLISNYDSRAVWKAQWR